MRRILLAFTASLLLASCGGVAGPEDNRVRNFDGTVIPNGTTIDPDFHFRVTRNGEFDLELTAFSVPNTQVGVSLGTSAPNGGCLDLIVRFLFVGQGFSGPMPSGDYCLAVFDQGALTEPATFNVRITTPN